MRKLIIKTLDVLVAMLTAYEVLEWILILGFFVAIATFRILTNVFAH